jgi:DegV family protein with EDD domain
VTRVAIVTDSTALIPPELSEGLPIYTIPQHLIWGGKNYQDNIDIQANEFYERLKIDPTAPQTSQITPEEFKPLFQQLCEQGCQILCIHVSARLTGTLDSAVRASQAFPGTMFAFVDSLSAAMGLGFQVIAAARAAARGAALAECQQLAEQACRLSGTMFVPGTLEYLHRGGRIGGASALVGSVLQIKPVLEVQEGVVAVIDRIRTLNRAVDRMLDLFSQRVGDRSPVHIAALHSNFHHMAVSVMDRVCERLGKERLRTRIISDISPVVGTHIGPDAVGLAYLAGMEL